MVVRWSASTSRSRSAQATSNTRSSAVPRPGGCSRRNLDNFNLETDVLVRTQATSQVFEDAKRHFDLLWQNQPGRRFSVPYAHYRNPSVVKRWLSRFMEATGFSTF